MTTMTANEKIVTYLIALTMFVLVEVCAATEVYMAGSKFDVVIGTSVGCIVAALLVITVNSIRKAPLTKKDAR